MDAENSQLFCLPGIEDIKIGRKHHFPVSGGLCHSKEETLQGVGGIASVVFGCLRKSVYAEISSGSVHERNRLTSRRRDHFVQVQIAEDRKHKVVGLVERKPGKRQMPHFPNIRIYILHKNLRVSGMAVKRNLLSVSGYEIKVS